MAAKKKKGVKPAKKAKARKPVRKPVAKRTAERKVAPKAKARPAARPTNGRAGKPVKKVKQSKPKALKVKPVLAKRKTPSKPAPAKQVVKTVADPIPPPAPQKPAAAPAPKKTVATPKPPEPKAPVVAVMTNVDPLSGPVRSLKKALKERFTVETYIHSTPFALYEMISTPSGLSKWFCDDVNVRGEEFTFVWGMDQQTAEVLSRKQGELIRLHWKDDDDEGSYFELRIRIDPLTNEVALVVTDHAWPKELQEARQLWESQVHTLQRALGA